MARPLKVVRIPFHFDLLLAGLVGFIALVYEIVWARVYSFATASRAVAFGFMLGSYLLGLAIGSLVSRHWQKRGTQQSVALQSVARLMVTANVVAFLVVPLVSWTVVVTHWVFTLPLVTVGATLLGTLLPLLCHAAIPPDENVGVRMSYVYIANIAGSGLGSLLTGFYLFEYCNLQQIAQGSLLLALVLCLVVSHFFERTPADYATWALTGGLILSAPILYQELFERLQYRADYWINRPFVTVLENRHGVITVDDEKKVHGGGIYDGMMDTRPTHGGGLIRPYFISALHAAPREILVIGMSGGAWTQILAHHPQADQVTVVEINSGYLRLLASYPEVSSLLTNPKVEIVIDDGRRWLRRNPGRHFDVIVMNTSYHWREFASNLLGKEFLQLGRRHLKPGGLMMWNTTGSSRAAATGLAVFPHTMMVSNNCVGSDAPLLIDQARWRRILSTYRIDDRPVFDLSSETGRKELEQMLWVANPDNPSGSLMFRPALETNYGTAKLITDDNLGEEYGFVLRDNLFLKKIFRR